MSTTEPTMGRRRLLQTAAATGAFAAGASRTMPPRYSPVGRAAAAVPALPVAVVGGAIMYDTYQQYYNNDPDVDDSTSGSVHSDIVANHTQDLVQVYNNLTFMEDGLPGRKMQTWSQINELVVENLRADTIPAESETQAQCHDLIDEEYTKLMKNINKEQRAAMLAIEKNISTVETVEGITIQDVYPGYYDSDRPTVEVKDWAPGSYVDSSWTYPNGDDHNVKMVEISGGGMASSYRMWYIGINDNGNIEAQAHRDHLVAPHGDLADHPDVPDQLQNAGNEDVDTIQFLPQDLITRIGNQIQADYQELHDQVDAYVSSLYNNYTGEDFDATELLNAYTLAEQYGTQDGMTYAAAELALLGIGGEIGSTAVIEYEATDGNVYELEGNLFTNVDFGSWETTEDYGASISDGVLTFTNPPVWARYRITTTDSETVEVEETQFTEVTETTTNDDGEEVEETVGYEVDLSADLEFTATSVDSVEEYVQEVPVDTRIVPADHSGSFYLADGTDWESQGFEVDESTGDLLRLTEPFTVLSATDREGNEIDSIRTKDRTEYADGDVEQILQEFERLAELQQEILEAEAAANDSGGGGSSGGLTDEYYGIPVFGWVLGSLAGLGLIGAAANQSQ